ncbi:hypothetical protein DIPPA_01094 [Diplonema papillatum]|nr:hypothetical protein DIPPA_01094 [Diplonema papillatum]
MVFQTMMTCVLLAVLVNVNVAEESFAEAAGKIMQEYDVDSNGYLNREEAESWIRRTILEPELEALDGESRAEYMQMLSEEGTDIIGEFMDEGDADKDGKLSSEEVENLLGMTDGSHEEDEY